MLVASGFSTRHVLAGPKRLAGERVVRRGGGRDYHRVNTRVGQDLLEVLLQLNGWVTPLCARERIQVEVTDGSDFYVRCLRKIADQVLTPVTATDDCDSDFIHGSERLPLLSTYLLGLLPEELLFSP